MSEGTHYKGCGLWNEGHAACATTDELLEAITMICGEAYSDGITAGHPLNCSQPGVNADRTRRLDLYLAEVRKRIEAKAVKP